eukprot:jgi/Hompol1/4607/HPOL_003744-RA
MSKRGRSSSAASTKKRRTSAKDDPSDDAHSALSLSSGAQIQTQLSFGPAAGRSNSSNSLEPVTWRTLHDTLLVGETVARPYVPCTKIAGFDFDGTLAEMNGKHVQPKNGDDWSWFSPSVPAVLRRLHSLGFGIVIFSNQKSILEPASGQSKFAAAFKGRVRHVVNALASSDSSHGDMPPILFLAAGEDDFFRKPRPGMWHLFESQLNGGIAIRRDLSFYCGDAAGRYISDQDPMLALGGSDEEMHPTTHAWSKASLARKDHADTDHKWALNVGIRFIVPQVLFHPKSLLALVDLCSQHKDLPTDSARRDLQLALPDHLEPPASGKSTFVRRHILSAMPPSSIVHINQDTLGKKEKCLQLATQSLTAGTSIIVDNTNPDAATRANYLSLASLATNASSSTQPPRRIHLTALVFGHNRPLNDHNKSYRKIQRHARSLVATLNLAGSHQQLSPFDDQTAQPHVPDMVVRMFWNRFQMPLASEGFDLILHVPFVPAFSNQYEHDFWKMFYT